MTLQTYFNNRKHYFATFFQQFRQTINQLSVQVQLQIDRQYFSTHSLLHGLSNTEIQNQCKSMKQKQILLLKGIINIICQHVKKCCQGTNIMKTPMKTLVQHPLTYLQAQAPNNVRNNKPNPHFPSASKSQLNTQGRSSNQLSIRKQQKSANSNAISSFNINNENWNKKEQKKRNTSKQKSITNNKNVNKISEPIQLGQYHHKNNSIVHDSNIINNNVLSNKYNLISQPKIIVNHNNQHHRRNSIGNDYLENQRRKSLNQNLFYQWERNQMRNNNGQDGFMQCENRDQHIHEEALQLFNKVKSKRNRHQQHQTNQYRSISPIKIEENIPKQIDSGDNSQVWKKIVYELSDFENQLGRSQ